MRRSAKFGLYAVVLAGVVGGTVAWAGSSATSVQLRIDGQAQQLHTTAHTVKAALADAHIEVGDHDIIAPDLSTALHNGSEIVVRRGHLLHLTVDGRSREIWVNAASVDEALSQLGYDRQNLVSVSRSKRLDAGVTDLTIASPKQITFIADGKRRVVVSAEPTVYEAIAEAGIYLGPGDRLSVAGESTLKDGQVVRIQRVSYKTTVEQVSVPFQTVKQTDATAYVGNESVVTAGKPGTSKVTYRLLFIDGKLAGKIAQSTVVSVAPVNQVTKVGSKPAPSIIANATGAQKIAATMVTARGWGADQFQCLVSLWSKESGWRVNAANPSGAYGIPQALPGSKMAAFGADWETNPATQIAWGLSYIAGRYGTPCGAWSHSQSYNWY